MAKTKSSEREKARKLYLKSNRKLKNKEIASKLGVSASLVAKWKSQDKWDSEVLPKEPPKGNKGGAPKGNKNAVGSVGGGAAIGNTNALKHGGYSQVYWDTLDDEEKSMIEDMPKSEEDMLIDQIKLLSVRERRLMHIINHYRNAKTEDGKPLSQVMVGMRTYQENKAFKNDANRERYNELVQEKIEEGKISYLYEPVKVEHTAESVHSIIQRLERELTSVQNAKTRAIAELAHLHFEQARTNDQSGNNAIVDDWISGVMGEDNEQT